MNTERTKGPLSGESTLVARGLKKSYSGFEAVKGVDFRVSYYQNGVWTAPGGDKIAWFADPDGNVLSLTQFG